MELFTRDQRAQYDRLCDSMTARLEEAVKPDVLRALEEGGNSSLISMSVVYGAICLAARYGVLTLVGAKLQVTDAQEPSREEHRAMAVRLRDRLMGSLERGLCKEADALGGTEPFLWPGKPGTA